jgi:hypothetical protein
VFAIATTTVHCTATDAAGNVAFGSFLVHVKGGAEQLADLAAAVDGLGPGTSLAAEVADAQLLLSLDKGGAAADVLGAFANEVSAQSGKKIAVARAAALLADANRIRAVLGSS